MPTAAPQASPQALLLATLMAKADGDDAAARDIASLDANHAGVLLGSGHDDGGEPGEEVPDEDATPPDDEH